MAMVHCRGCGQQIHESAVTCPHCGAPQKTTATQGSQEALPDGIRGWSWGAFFLNWIWAISNGVWIGLLVLIPVVGFVMAFVLGFKGREWAWRAKRWQNVEHFQRVQRKWSVWAVGIMMASAALVGISAGVASYHQSSLRNKAAQAAAEQTSKAEAAAADYQRRLVAEASQRDAERKALDEATRVAALEATIRAASQNTLAPGATEINLPAITNSTSSTSASNDLLEGARGCASQTQCVQYMLAGAFPRKADVVQAAATHMSGLPKPDQGDRKTARDFNKQGLERFNVQDFDGAQKLLQQAAIADPSDVEIKSNLGLALVKAGLPKQAQGVLVGALGLDPRRSAAWVPFAQALAAQNETEASHRALLLAYEFSANKQRTLDYYKGRADDLASAENERTLFGKALARVEAGY